MSGSTLRETLFAGSTVRLFGRVFEGLTLVPDDTLLQAQQERLQAVVAALEAEINALPEDMRPAAIALRAALGRARAALDAINIPDIEQNIPGGAPPELRAQQAQLKFRNFETGVQPGLARIYGFSIQGNYFKLAAPTVLLVYGIGIAVPPTINEVDLSTLGVEFKDETFASEVRMWAQDQTDYSVRIDITTGWLQDILVNPEMSDSNNVTGGLSPEAGNQMAGRGMLVGRGRAVGRNS